MGFLVDIAQPFYAVVCIHLGGSQTAVAKKLFDGVQLCPIAGKMGGKTVAQHMGTFLFCSGDQREVFFDNVIDLASSGRFLTGCQQQLGEDGIGEQGTFLCLKSPDPVCKRLVQGDDPFLVALSQYFQLVPGKVDLAGFQADQLTDPHTRMVEQGQDQVISPAHEVVTEWSFIQQFLHLVLLHIRRQAFPGLQDLNVFGGIGIHMTMHHAIAKKRL